MCQERSLTVMIIIIHTLFYFSDQISDRKDMTIFWEKFNKPVEKLTVREAMLDPDSKNLDKFERPEILSLLPDVTGMKVLELGAGIG